ncbi:4593_t:CDS:1, partial [Dentiscutata erythropus]
AELHQFLMMYKLENEINTGTKDFPGEMLKPENIQVTLPDNIYKLLVEYYNNCYQSTFVPIGEIGPSTTVRPLINQFGRIRIGSEIFGSSMAPRYQK